LVKHFLITVYPKTHKKATLLTKFLLKILPTAQRELLKIFTNGKKIMVTQVQHDLIRLLKSFGLDMETTVSTVALCRTDENRAKMIGMIIARYDEKGEVTEQDIHKIGLLLTGSLKQSPTNSTKTEADTD